MSHFQDLSGTIPATHVAEARTAAPYPPAALYEAGISDLVSVAPPGAQLTQRSKISQAQLGKVPGRRLPNGLWAGYDWRRAEHTLDDVHGWNSAGANVGLRADRFPAVDIDCTDDRLTVIIERAALAKLGSAPSRTGRAPKRLLMYRTAEPFGRMRLWIAKAGQTHLVEVLGQGQQYLVHGTHPGTMQAYIWDRDIAAITADSLTPISRTQVDEFLVHLTEVLVTVDGVTEVKREGDGRPITRTAAAEQSTLLAPALDELRAAVEYIPNNNELFPDRTSYLRMGYAIKAAAGLEYEEDGFELFAAWAAKWEGNDRADGNDPDVVREDWRRMTGDKAVGWGWLAEQARAFGYNDAALDFDAIGAAPEVHTGPTAAPSYSDQWLADKVVERQQGMLRFVPQRGTWLVWSDGRWASDVELLAESTILHELRMIAAEVARHGATAAERKKAQALAVSICSAAKATAVGAIVRRDRSVAVSQDALDRDTWLLNTPGGIIDLRTGELRPADPYALCTKSTAVPPAFGEACPTWRSFLAAATGSDAELESYLQRLFGYVLTGSTREHHLTFIWGPGGNGKGVFLNAMNGILGDYARPADMNTFTARAGEAHTTELAMLAGARLVTASETQAGKRWDEARVKALTGGDPVTARFMRQDNFTFLPQFKLVFAGNHQPELRHVDDAMRRRVHMVPFTNKPSKPDPELADKLRREWPAILAWAIEGCLAWQREGLNPPAVVRAATDDYFSEEDLLGQWIDELCERRASETCSLKDLFAAWREYANALGQQIGHDRMLSRALKARGFKTLKHSTTRAQPISSGSPFAKRYALGSPCDPSRHIGGAVVLPGAAEAAPGRCGGPASLPRRAHGGCHRRYRPPHRGRAHCRRRPTRHYRRSSGDHRVHAGPHRSSSPERIHPKCGAQACPSASGGRLAVQAP